jgi:serine/threonine protein kinase
MMHLDVKPANILLDENDNAVLIDFGLAKQYDTEGQQTSCNPVGISHGYAPLEQYKRDGVSTFSPATDIYSLGATLFKLVTGITPPEASDVNDEGLPALPSDISPTVRAAIEAAMEPKRKDRPQSIAEFLKLLENGGESKDERAESKDETLLNSSSTPGGEVSRSDGGESELSKVKTENGKLKTASYDDEETQVDINPLRPSATPPFEKVGELSNSVNDDEETLLNSENGVDDATLHTESVSVLQIDKPSFKKENKKIKA